MAGPITRALAEFAAGIPSSNIPDSAREAALRCLLDTLACGVAGLTETSSQILCDVVEQEAISGPCTALGLGRLVSARQAALMNGAAAHALDFDDTHDHAVLHPGVVVIPAALAAAESIGSGGLSFLDALVIGYDVHVRVALAATRAPGHTGWHYTSACGVFGAAAAAGRLLGLDAGRMTDAFGLAGAQASGTLQSERDGTWAKRLQPGLAASAGILAVQLAARGFCGPGEALEGTFGFYRVYLKEFNIMHILESLGARFEVERTSLKPFPACRFSHAPAAALQHLIREHGLEKNDIAAIEARVTSAAFAEVCEPWAEKVRPKSRVHAQFSLPYALACVAHHGEVTLADLTDQGIGREEVLAIAERVRCVRDPELEATWGEKIGEAEVRVRIQGGQEFRARALPPGSPEMPLSEDQIRRKIAQCLEYGAVDFPVKDFLRAVRRIGSAENLRELSAMLGYLRRCAS